MKLLKFIVFIFRLDDLVDFVNRTKDLAEDAKTEANTVYDDALGIYTDANSLVVPTANVETLQNDASRIKMEVIKILIKLNL